MSSRAVRSGHARSGTLRPRSPDNSPVPLFPALARATPAQADMVPAIAPRELWLGVHLPWLPIEALEAPEWPRRQERQNSKDAYAFPRAALRSSQQPATQAPRAVVELQGQTQYIVAVCERAERLGVRSGMSLAAALALVPQLETKPKDPPREKQLLERLATAAQRFTPRVSLVPPDGLLLEVKGSLHLFNGAEGLCRALEEEYRAAGVKPLLSLAPVPLAALAGARAGNPFSITQPAHLVSHLAPLPLLALRWPADVLQRLQQIGVHTIGEALRLPRAGFARRFGKPQLAMLDRLTGRDADLRPRFQARERFQRRHTMLYELEHHEAILNTLEPLLQELGAFLKARQCGITRLDCLLQHRHAPATRCVLKLAAPAANARHFAKLFGERLAALSLPEPVRALELRSGRLELRAPVADSLWQSGEHGGELHSEAPELIEHLRARLGHEAVYGLQILASHRPETAWAATDLTDTRLHAGESRNRLSAAPAKPRQSSTASIQQPAATASQSVTPSAGQAPPWPAFRRPTWLLPAPQPLRERDGLPRRRGPLQLLSGAERIESAWWDGGDIARDYYMAVDIHGVRLWIFRERTPPHRWFLHGIFG